MLENVFKLNTIQKLARRPNLKFRWLGDWSKTITLRLSLKRSGRDTAF